MNVNEWMGRKKCTWIRNGLSYNVYVSLQIYTMRKSGQGNNNNNMHVYTG